MSERSDAAVIFSSGKEGDRSPSARMYQCLVSHFGELFAKAGVENYKILIGFMARDNVDLGTNHI